MCQSCADSSLNNLNYFNACQIHREEGTLLAKGYNRIERSRFLEGKTRSISSITSHLGSAGFSRSSSTAENELGLLRQRHIVSGLRGLNLLTSPQEEGKLQALLAAENLLGMHKLKQKLVYHLCRGQISGWIVVESSRDFMNVKKSCACETCDFIGNYTDLRKHD